MKKQPGYKKIQDKAIELLKKNPDGLRFKVLVDETQKILSDINQNFIYTVISTLANERSKSVYKPTRGLYKYTEDGFIPDDEVIETPKEVKYGELIFYEPVARYLKNELDECTESIPLGNSSFKSKWGTPDVIGVFKPMKSDLVSFQTDIITAEIKTNVSQTIVAFGQAISYRLFSSKVFLFLPKSLNEEDSGRIKSLCQLFGIGLVKFDSNKPDNPNWEIIVSAQRFDPDYYYVNQIAKKLLEIDKTKYNILFSSVY